jgi:glycosyltransferase involved in cell wall biosynthesis
MHVAMVGCPFQTSYGAYIDSLQAALARRDGVRVGWVASNCGCGDPIERGRHFQTTSCTYFELRQLGDHPSPSRWKEALRLSARSALSYVRAARFAQVADGADVVHFQQILNAYGSDVVFHWLRRPSRAARVVTVHELDAQQTVHPARNREYNRADAIVVHAEELRDKLVSLGVDPRLVHVVRHGADVPAGAPTGPRDGLVFYGGHKLLSGKGIEVLFDALALLGRRPDVGTLRLRIHGHYGAEVPPAARALAERTGVADRIDWLNQLPIPEIEKLYRSSLLCVLPYSGSFAGLPAAVAAASALPVVATRRAGIPDHLGEAGVWVRGDDPAELADRVAALIADAPQRQRLSEAVHRRAREVLSWDAIAAATSAVYQAALTRHAARALLGGTPAPAA